MLSVAPFSIAAHPAPTRPFLLLVDDHEPSLRKLEVLLESVGYACVSTLCSSEALAYCRTRRPSLVVTDLAMPQLDGHDLACGLKARFPGLPIVLLTGEMLDASRQEKLSRTFTSVFSKPLEVESFLALIESLMPR
jgi:CheY-like chemotaxis protein